MRAYIVLAAFALTAVACEGRHTLTGPDAQRAYARAAADQNAIVLGRTLVFVDGKRMPAGSRLDQIDPKMIVRIEILKGQAAVGTYGEEGRAGVINIYTRPGQPDSTGRQ